MTSDHTWKPRLFHDRDLPQVLELFKTILDQELSPEAFHWWFTHNPWGTRNIQVAEEENTIIGVACHNAFPMLWNGEQHLVSFPLNVLTHPDHRGKGIFTRLERRAEEFAADNGASFFLSVPNDASTPIFTNKLGWSERIPEPLQGLPSNLIPQQKVFRSWSKVYWKYLVGNPRFQLTSVTSFTKAIDDIWSRSYSSHPLTMWRSQEYLNWRFARAVDKNYQLYEVQVQGDTVGYGVTGVTQKRQFKVGFIAHSLLLPEWSHLYGQLHHELLGPIIEDCHLVLDWRSQHLAELSQETIPHFIPLPKRFRCIYKDGTTRLPHNLQNPQKNWMQLGDLDFF